jgi:hypothetical protein
VLNYEFSNIIFEPPSHASTLLPNLRWKILTNAIIIKGAKIVIDCNKKKNTPFQVLKIVKNYVEMMFT